MHFHTCSDLRNATHFNVATLTDVEEWEMFVELEHQMFTPPTMIDSGTRKDWSDSKWEEGKLGDSTKFSCPVSNTASHGLFPGCPKLHLEMKAKISDNCAGCGSDPPGSADKQKDGLKWDQAAQPPHKRQFVDGSFRLKLVEFTDTMNQGLRSNLPATASDPTKVNWQTDSFEDPSDLKSYLSRKHCARTDKNQAKVGRVNWGKLDGAPDTTAYKNGKTDGILECIHDEAQDLLLYSLMKMYAACETVETDEVTKADWKGAIASQTKHSNCRNPEEFSEFRRQPGTFHYAVASEGDNPQEMSNGREMPRKTEKCRCKKQLEDGAGSDIPALEQCGCGVLARTTRIVLTPDYTEGVSFTTETPYAPEWIVEAATSICNIGQVGRVERRGLNPRRVCKREHLEAADFWKDQSYDSKNDQYFRKEELDVRFVTRETWPNYEIEQMENCANSGCAPLTLDLTVPQDDGRRYMITAPVNDEGACLDEGYEGEGCLQERWLLNNELHADDNLGGRRVCAAVKIQNNVKCAAKPPYWKELYEEMDVTLNDDGYYTVDSNQADNNTNARSAWVMEASLRGYGVILHELDMTISVDMSRYQTAMGKEVTDAFLQGECAAGVGMWEIVHDQDTEQLIHEIPLERNEATGLWHSGVLDMPLRCIVSSKFHVYASVNGGIDFVNDAVDLRNNGGCLFDNTQPAVVKHYKGGVGTKNLEVWDAPCLTPTLLSALRTSGAVQVTVGEEGYCTTTKCIQQPENTAVPCPNTGKTLDDLVKEDGAEVSYVDYVYHNIEPTEQDGINWFVRWGECGFKIQVEWKNDTDATLFYNNAIVKSRLIEMPSIDAPQQFEYRNTLPGHENVRELCFQVGTAPFAREITEANRGEILSLGLGDCQQCTPGRPQAIINAVVFVPLAGGLDTRLKHFGTDSAQRCSWSCQNTTNCTAFAYTAQTCSLYNEHPSLGQSTGLSLAVTPAQAVAWERDIVVFCVDGEDGAVTRTVIEPPMEMEKCPAWAGKTGTYPDCFQTPCNPKTERAIRLNVDEVGCTDRKHPDCRRLCNPTYSQPQRRLFTDNTAIQGEWRKNETHAYGTNAKYPLADEPYYQFHLPGSNDSTLAQLHIRLPMIEPACMYFNGSADVDEEDTTLEVSLSYEDDEPFTEKVTLELDESGNSNAFRGVKLEFVDHRGDGTREGFYRIKFRAVGSSNLIIYNQEPVPFCETGLTIEEIVAEVNGSHVPLHATVNATSLNSELYVSRVGYCKSEGNMHICWPHKVCKPDVEWQVKAGTIDTDTVCARQPTCRFDEYVTKNATETSARECTPHTVCTGTEVTATTGTLDGDATCGLRAACKKDEFNMPSPYAAEGGCTRIKVCDENEKEQMPPTLFSDAVCETYTIECTETEYETAERTASTEKTCTAATVCGTDSYVSSAAAPIQERECRPILKCTSYDVETQSGGVTRQTVCVSMLQWSAAWIYAIIGTPLFAAVAFRSWRI